MKTRCLESNHFKKNGFLEFEFSVPVQFGMQFVVGYFSRARNMFF